ncbi:uncharacterized protein LOC129748572 [Uranotaenia lowii]|uniref:uncharacterized protein LOC129748572 n=1 Tax=Uranotaenia lowii TaxID=190385 RepID=UPI002478AF10|nr:uncharacterized protein LOC129748572 [Uranotaenia lowii]
MAFQKNIWQSAASGDRQNLQQCLNKKSARKSGLAKVSSLRDNHNWTVLHHAVASGNPDCVELLLTKSDVDVQARCYEGRTALMLGCMRDVPLKIIDMLIGKCGILVNVSSMEFVSPLHVAVERKNLPLVELLVASGANVNAQDYAKETPLHSALEAGDLGILIHLLYVGKADVTVVTEYGITPLEILSARANYEQKLKVACFKMLFNFVHPLNAHKMKYPIEDIFECAVLSYRNVSLVPHFVETALLWENNLDKRRLALELLEGPRDQYQTSRISNTVNHNLFQLLALLLVDSQGIQRLEQQYTELSLCDSFCELIQNEMAAFTVAAIRENDDGRMYRMILEYLEYFKASNYFVSSQIEPTLNIVKSALINYEIEHEDLLSQEELSRYQTIVDRFVAISNTDANSILLSMTHETKGTEEALIKYFQPVVRYCTNLFMERRVHGPPRYPMYWSLLQRYGSFELVSDYYENGISLENFSLRRLARDSVRKQVLSTVEDSGGRADLMFVERIKALGIPKALIQYLLYQ